MINTLDNTSGSNPENHIICAVIISGTSAKVYSECVITAMNTVVTSIESSKGKHTVTWYRADLNKPEYII